MGRNKTEERKGAREREKIKYLWQGAEKREEKGARQTDRRNKRYVPVIQIVGVYMDYNVCMEMFVLVRSTETGPRF